MKKFYVAPEMEVEVVDVESTILTTSVNDPNNIPDGDNAPGDLFS